MKKAYSFRELDKEGNISRQAICHTLRELSQEVNITTSTLYRIKSNKTQGKNKGRYVNCYIDTVNRE